MSEDFCGICLAPPGAGHKPECLNVPVRCTHGPYCLWCNPIGPRPPKRSTT